MDSLDVGADLGRQNAGQLGHLDGVRQLILPVGRAELQPAHHAQHLGVQAGNAGLEGGLFAGFIDDPVDRLAFLFQDLLDVRRVNATVDRQAGEGAAGNLAADGVEAGDGDRLRRVVHDDVHAGGLFEGLDVAAVAADDAALHFFIGQRHDRGRHLGHVLGGDALDGVGNQLAGALLAFFAGFGLDLAVDAGHVGTGFLFHGGQQLLLGLILRKLRDLLQAGDLVFVELVDVVGALVNRALALVEGLLALLQLVGAAVEFGAALVEPIRFLAELDASLFELGLRGLHDLGGVVTGLRIDQPGLFVGHAQDIVCLVLLIL